MTEILEMIQVTYQFYRKKITKSQMTTTNVIKW
jgi:hypothetical protein